MAVLCAYCDSPGKLSKEHIWPACIIKHTNYNMRYSKPAKKVLNKIDLVVKDVCLKCNNGVLSSLDAYGCELFESNFRVFHSAENQITLKYDYNKLLRWLLKISFNSARSDHTDEKLFDQYKHFILHGEETPSNLSIMIEVLSTEKHDNGELIEANSTRSGKVYFPKNSFSWVSVRLVSINAFCFYLVFQTSPLKAVTAAEAFAFLRAIPGELMDPVKTEMSLIISHRNASEFHKLLFETNKEIFENFILENSQKRKKE